MTGLRALHLFSNFKWTGPADPAIRCARALRRAGADVVFAQAAFRRGEEHRMSIELRRERVPVTGDMELPKHFRPRDVWRDARVLARRLRRGDFDLMHTHLPGDHLTAALAKRFAGRPALLVRTIHDAEAPPRTLRSVLAFANTDGVVAPTRTCARQVAERFRLTSERVHLQEPTSDHGRFDRLRGDLRGRWGVGADEVLIGITARVQRHRRFEFLWDVAREVTGAAPRTRFVLLGRGHPDDLRDLVHAPIARLGLRDHVVLPGYLNEPEYSLALRSFDLFVFLVPGSDGTCRAAREAIAAGVPVVTTKRGILPELVSRRPEGPGEEPCGLAIEEDVTLFARAIVGLIENPEARARLRAGGRARVTGSMDETAAARRLLGFYGSLREWAS